MSMRVWVGIAVGLLGAGAQAATVLAPGESRVVGGEEVVCSVSSTSSFAKAYYQCVQDANANPYRTVHMEVSLIAEDGRTSSLGWENTQTGDSLAACESEMKVLNKNRGTINQYTEIAFCDQYWPSTAVSLGIYAFTTSGRIRLAKSVAVNSLDQCVNQANAINSR